MGIFSFDGKSMLPKAANHFAKGHILYRDMCPFALRNVCFCIAVAVWCMQKIFLLKTRHSSQLRVRR